MVGRPWHVWVFDFSPHGGGREGEGKKGGRENDEMMLQLFHTSCTGYIHGGKKS